jgi:cation diffusion facilitator CzcD-associated flavoprotein CzcO
MFMYQLSKRKPQVIKDFLMKGVHRALKTNAMDKHFSPKYNPWDQRLCFVPDGDFFKAIKKEKATIVTDTIKEFTPNGILLDSGEELAADIIISATGLQLQLLGGMSYDVDGVKLAPNELHSYKGVMFSNIPNFAFAVGYTNASWTLKCDLNCQFVVRLLNFMDKNNKSVVIPNFDASLFESEPLLDFDSGYVKRAAAFLPKQGSKKPWKVHQNYIKDTISLKMEKINNKYLVFS